MSLLIFPVTIFYIFCFYKAILFFSEKVRFFMLNCRISVFPGLFSFHLPYYMLFFWMRPENAAQRRQYCECDYYNVRRHTNIKNIFPGKMETYQCADAAYMYAAPDLLHGRPARQPGRFSEHNYHGGIPELSVFSSPCGLFSYCSISAHKDISE